MVEALRQARSGQPGREPASRRDILRHAEYIRDKVDPRHGRGARGGGPSSRRWWPTISGRCRSTRRSCSSSRLRRRGRTRAPEPSGRTATCGRPGGFRYGDSPVWHRPARRAVAGHRGIAGRAAQVLGACWRWWPPSGSVAPSPRRAAPPPAAGNPLTRSRDVDLGARLSSRRQRSQIIASAHQYGVGTLIIKSSDGTSFWSSQFTPQLVSALHAGGMQRVRLAVRVRQPPDHRGLQGRRAVRDGADCLIIDAETEYQGKYVPAQSYIRRLRTLIGSATRSPWPASPTSTTTPGSRTRSSSDPAGLSTTCRRCTGGTSARPPTRCSPTPTRTTGSTSARSIPLGQIYGSPPAHQIFRFRQLSRAYGAGGVSWWDWQAATP